MIKSALAGLTLHTFLALAVVGAATAETDLPDGRLSVEPPAGFVPSHSFSGYESPETGASLLLTLQPAEAYPRLKEDFSEEALTRQGMQFLSVEEFFGAPFLGFVVAARKTVGATAFHKWFLVTSEPTLTGLVTLTVPEATLDRLDRAALRRSLLSVKALQSTEGVMANLPFSARETRRFAFGDTLADTTLIYREREKTSDRDPAVFVMAASFEHRPKASLRTYSDRLLRTVPTIRLAGIDRYSNVKIDGLDGLEAQGRCSYTDSDRPCAIYHVVLFDQSRYYRFLGLVPVEETESAFRDFRKLAESFRRR